MSSLPVFPLIDAAEMERFTKQVLGAGGWALGSGCWGWVLGSGSWELASGNWDCKGKVLDAVLSVLANSKL
jgi:hypothetical protein